MKFDDKFKEAIAHLPSSEKDKLILRLLKKDLDLANRLSFELLGDQTVAERRLEMETRVRIRVQQISEMFWSIGYLKMDMGSLSAEITEHVKITKDKYGEASLNLLMLIETLKLNNDRILNAPPRKAYKMSVYIIAKAFKILMIINKLHEDYLLEFQDKLVKLGELIGQNHHIMKTAIQNGFNVNWLLKAEIPEDIVHIHKELRSQGFLK